MASSNRRSFIAASAAGVAGATVLRTARGGQVSDPSERVRVAVIGCGGQGNAHISALRTLQDVQIVYVCDPDSKRLSAAQGKAAGAKAVTDLRAILDDRSVDAVTIATPDHWHATAALLAVAAGKHVYVEKPCAHNVREGRLLLDAARRYKRVVQHGTQSRSGDGLAHAIELLREGMIGDVLIAKAWNWQRRRNIGHSKPSPPPAEVDYDMWVGPAEMVPFQANRFHYDWHWWYNFGCGGMGNDGIHDLDYALWGLGVQSHPTSVSAIGGKYYFDDDQQFPDTQQVTFEYPHDGQVGNKRMLIYEQRLWSTSYPYNVDSGAEFFGTEGKMFLSKRGKIQILGPRNQRIDRTPQGPLTGSVAVHQQNWIDCIKSGGRPRADIAIAHRTATVVHLGNIATRVARSLRFDPDSEQILGDDQANQLLRRKYRAEGHWAIPEEKSEG